MSSANALRALRKEHTAYEEMMSESGSGSLSSLVTPESRNELSEILEKMRLSETDFSATSPSDSSSGAAKKPAEESDVKLQRRALRIVAHETEKAANNILLHVKYLTAPLRLYLKTQLQTKSASERVAIANTIKISDAVKTDLVSDWNVKDAFGLKVLVKMYKMHQNLFPMFASHEQFLLYMQPLSDAAHESRKGITFFLYNVVMNPGAVYYAYDAPTSLEHELHEWMGGFLSEYAEDLEAVGFSVEDARTDLIRKVTLELNILASVIFKKPVSFKYSTGEALRLEPEALMKELFTMFSTMPGTQILAEQMAWWMTNDDNMVGAPRAITGGSMCAAMPGWTGGAAKRGRGRKARR